MKRALSVEELTGRPADELEVEFVERKGKGHPDALIDGAAEAVSDALSHYYLGKFGTILHYNVDKGILVGGRAEARFGGGRVVEPIYVMIAGRATNKVPTRGKGVEVPVSEIAKNAISDFIRRTMRFLDPERDVEKETRIRPGSPDLVSIFLKNKGMPLSNDTSVGVGYAPMTPTEKVVLQVEKTLNSPAFKQRLPEVGEDVKVAGVRTKGNLKLIVAAAIVSGQVRNPGQYISTIQDVKREVERIASVEGFEAQVEVNTGDDYSKNRFYLTATGTSAEQGDDGNTGRGNRVNGLISPMRHFSMEATAGKNPVNHTGKLYNAVALLASERIVREVRGVKECYVRMLSKIGSPIDQPEISSAGVILQEGVRLSAVSGDVESIMDESLSKIRETTALILERKVELF